MAGPPKSSISQSASTSCKFASCNTQHMHKKRSSSFLSKLVAASALAASHQCVCIEEYKACSFPLHHCRAS
jgi:hypothetical protein